MIVRRAANAELTTYKRIKILVSVNSCSQQHQMQLARIHPSGVQEWFCPSCTRRFIMQLQPGFNIVDLEVGDGFVSHTGSTGDIRIGLPQIRAGEEPVLPEDLLSALEEALKDVDFDDWEDTAD